MKRKRKLVRRNPEARALAERQFHQKRIPSKKLYQRRPRTPSGAEDFSGENILRVAVGGALY